MARGRMLNKSVSASLKFHNLPDDTCRLLATWILPYLDHRGVFYGSAEMVKSSIFPRRNDSPEVIEAHLKAMEEAGLMIRFRAKGDVWQYWPGFAHNQVGLRAERETSEYPPPPGKPAEQSQQVAGGLPEAIPPNDGTKPAEEKLSEEKLEVKEKLREEGAAIAAPARPPPETPPPKPEKSRKRQKKPLSPAVRTFRENAHRYPPGSWYADVTKIVGDAETDLAFWGKVVKAYVGQGWNPINVKNMLGFYERREVPGDGARASRGTTPPTEPAGFPAVRSYLAKLEAQSEVDT